MERRTAMYDIYTICRILIQFLKIIDKNNLSKTHIFDCRMMIQNAKKLTKTICPIIEKTQLFV